MAESRWSIALAGTVAAETEAVVRWWFHPDRRDEFLEAAETRGALDLTVTRSREDGAYVTILRYRTAQGWQFDHRLEIDLDENRMPPFSDDRYVAQSRDLQTARSGAQGFSVKCVAIHEFVAVSPGETRITARHEHTMTGGRWLWRWQRRRRDYPLNERFFTYKTAECERSLRPSEGGSSAT